MSDKVVDIRGEPCGMPVLRVENFLLKDSGGAPFTVLGDEPQTADQLRLLATRHGWMCEILPDTAGPWRAEFRRP